MSKRILDKLVVIDIESTCDEPRPEWQSEIIEIGVCLLDLNTLEITKPLGILVKNEFTPITKFCTGLTSLTQEMLDESGIPLQYAVNILRDEYNISSRTWASWGNYDRIMLEGECQDVAGGFPGAKSTHINLKNLLAVQNGWSKEIGVGEALARWGMPFLGRQHRGVDNAINIAKLYQKQLEFCRAAHLAR